MPTNDIKPFAAAGGANVLTQAEYLALAALSTGFSSGKASSKEVNKAVRQATFIASALAQFICDKGGNDVLDDGNVAGLVTKLIAAMNKTSQPLDATLTAIAQLTTATNKLPYFTGADVAALADFTGAARSLLARDSADSMLNYLGTGTAAKKNAQSNVFDNTAGTLMLLGAFGFGGVGATSANTDITNVYSLPIGDAGNPEPYQNYVHINLSGTSFYSSRIALSMNGTDNPRIFIKSRNGTTESVWTEVYTNRNPPNSVATLTTARKISVSGDASGYAMFNGGSDADISVTVADSAKGVIRLREGSVSTVGTSTPNFISIDTGLLVRGITFTAGAQTVNVRPLQMLIGTQWVTVGLS